MGIFGLFFGFVLLQLPFDLGEGVVLTLVPDRFKPACQFCVGARVHGFACHSLLQVLQGVALLIILAVVYAAGGYTVAAHFRSVVKGHFYGDVLALAPRHYVEPILPVVAVSSLVVEPCGAVALFLPLRLVGGALAGKIFYSGNKFAGAEFGKVVG